jgi:sugar/nucleoside kinase (ribokinase family)
MVRQAEAADVVAAGHVCLDVIPSFPASAAAGGEFFVPGTLRIVGEPAISTGGSVSNTGLALHRLGLPVRLVGKIGDDDFGRIVHSVFARHSPALTKGLVVSRQDQTSYTIILEPPGRDRMFLHCPGANDTFTAGDVTAAHLKGARLFHFGYPPIMRRMYQREGRELADLFRRVKKAGLTTSLDMAQPDPHSEAGQADWVAILQRVLPHVDVFLPSFDEIQYMLDPQEAARLQRLQGERKRAEVLKRLAPVAERLLDLGVAVVALKLGEDGLYLRTSPDRNRLAKCGACELNPLLWFGRECLAPCFQVELAGATGAGDCTIAGFLAGLLRGETPEGTMTTAVAVGACSVEQPDATSGVPSLDKVERRIRRGWQRKVQPLGLQDWSWDKDCGLWWGPNDLRADDG